jgi:hypothetical protein
MDESTRVRLAQRPCEFDRDAQKLRYSQWPAEQSIQDSAPRVLERQRQAVAVAGKLDGAGRPGGIKLGSERVLMFELRKTSERAALGNDQQNGRKSLTGTPKQRQFAIPQG